MAKMVKIAQGVFGVFASLSLLLALGAAPAPNASPEINNALMGATAITPQFQSYITTALPICNSTTTTTANSTGGLLTVSSGVVVMAANVSVAITPGLAVGASNSGSNNALVGCMANSNGGAVQWTVIG